MNIIYFIHEISQFMNIIDNIKIIIYFIHDLSQFLNVIFIL
jgi:hypothetical protein